MQYTLEIDAIITTAYFSLPSALAACNIEKMLPLPKEQ